MFLNKYKGFSLSEIGSDFQFLTKSKNESHEVNNADFHPTTTKDSVLEISDDLLEELLKPTYVSQNDDEQWKKKRKSR